MVNDAAKKRMRGAALALALLFCVFAGGCAQNSSAEPSVYMQTPNPSTEVAPPAGGAKADVINYIYTTKRAFAITFSGMADKEAMDTILDELDKYNMKALFFLPGVRVAEEPDIANEILKRGHTIGNNTLNGVDLTEMDYSDAYHEIDKASRVIQEKTGTAPKYLYNLGGKFDDSVLMAAEACGLDLVTYNINFHSWEGKTAAEVQYYLENKITRGGIIALSTKDPDCALDTIRLIAKVENEMGYSVQPLDYLIENSYERKPLEEIPGWDAAAINKLKDEPYHVVYNGLRNKKAVCLTFDDWGCDYSITRILDIMKQYGVKGTFFLRANGVVTNPNLAKAIAEEGHDVANHTFDHKVITTLTPDEVQSQVVRCHQALAQAIQAQPVMLMRPPTGEINEESARAIAATGYEYISLYDVTPNDWNTEKSADDITNYVKENTMDGSIIVFHLMIELETYKALPQIIEYMQEQGYDILPMSELIEAGDAEVLTELPAWATASPAPSASPTDTPKYE